MTTPGERLAQFVEGLLTATELEDRLALDDADPIAQRAATALNAFLDKLWVKEWELQAKQEMLEQVVQIRTKEVHEILDNVAAGFLIALRDGVILDNCSRSCTEIFRQSDLKGKTLPEVMHLDARARDNWIACYDQVFEDLLPVELSLDQLPKEFALEGRIYRIEGSPLRGVDGRVAKVFFTVTDTTELRNAERDNALRRALLEIVSQKEGFQAFLYETRQAFVEARGANKQTTLRNVLHTVKGNLGCYGLHEIASLVHAIEDKPSLGAEDLDTVEGTLRKFLEVHRSILGFGYPTDGRPTRQIDVEQLVPFLAGLAREESPAARRAAVASFVERLTWVPARALLSPLHGVVQRGAERLEKDVELVIEGGDLLLDVTLLGTVVANLGHLVRNSLDHGIEPPDRRGDKPPRGQILVRCREAADDWILDVEDDGAGVDADALVRAAVRKGVLTEEAAASLDAEGRLRLLFADGVSTRDVVTTLSGRGVGTSSLLATVEERGGEVEVFSEPGRGTRFRLRVPRRPPPPALPSEAPRALTFTFPPLWGEGGTRRVDSLTLPIVRP